MQGLRRSAAVFALAAAPLAATCSGARDLDMEDAWVQSAPPSSNVQAGYFTLRNRTDHPVAITGAQSAAFGRVEVHETVLRQGVARMRRVARLVVPPGGSIELAPGGRHLMLSDPERPHAPGDEVEIVLELEDGTQRAFPFEVRTVPRHPGATAR